MNAPGIFETAKSSYNFFSDNRSHFINVVLPLLPFLYLSYLSSATAQILEKAEIPQPAAFSVFQVISFIMGLLCAFALMAAWHRATILGVSEENKMRLTRFTPRDRSFLVAMIKLTFVYIVMIIVYALSLLIAKAISPLLLFVAMVAGGLVLVYFFVRLYLYIPATAANADVTLREAMHLSRGIVLKMVFALLVAGIPVVLVGAVCGGIAGAVLSMFYPPAGFGEALIFAAGLSVPGVIFQAIATAIGVTVISRYYLWAVQERG